MVFLWKGDGMMNNRAIETAKKLKKNLQSYMMCQFHLLYGRVITNIFW